MNAQQIRQVRLNLAAYAERLAECGVSVGEDVPVYHHGEQQRERDASFDDGEVTNREQEE
jgi:hypothetical protein